MTRLEAIQRIMEAAGMRSPSSETANDATVIAGQMLDRATKDILSRGWHWNTREDVELTPEPDGTINMPDGAITIDSYGRSAHKNVAQVGRTLFDLKENTSTFTENLWVTYTVLYDFDCIPEPLAAYIAQQVAFDYNEEYGHQPRNRSQVNYDKLVKAKAQANRWNEQSSDRGAMSGGQRRNVLGGRLEGYGYIR